MNGKDDISARNRSWWQQMAAEGCSFTQPWLDLTKQEILDYCSGQLNQHARLRNIYPRWILENVQDKEVLCLASGGGQQSVVFGLLGATVTVLDFSEKQLVGDRRAADHHGYQITTLLADMRDLSMLAENSFDLVYQAPSMAYIPEINSVYVGVARVLRPGGDYRVAHTNPAVEFVDLESWDGEGYRISKPYSVKKDADGEIGSVQFRHYLKEIFGGLIDTGFSIRQVIEAPGHFEPHNQAAPGTWEHSQIYLPWQFVILARKLP
jgi:ubiquinone/menaquinone biosynthesis C-methylase UbiE